MSECSVTTTHIPLDIVLTIVLRQRGTNSTILAYPPGFRMVAGNPFLRSYSGSYAQQAISFACLNYNGPEPAETHDLPNYNCPNGVRAQVYFPSCWDGVNLDSPNHYSHMSYPDPNLPGSYNGGTCPSSHPVQMISIFFETIYQTNLFANDWYGNSQPFVFAMGDPTGYGYHGDFVRTTRLQHSTAMLRNPRSTAGMFQRCRPS